MSMVMQMLGMNLPLSRWEEFQLGELKGPQCGSRKLDNVARAILAQLTHPKTVELVARDWEQLPSLVRVRFTDLANQEYRNPSSHNKARKIKDLDRRLGGKILSSTHQVTESGLRVVDGRLTRVHLRVRPEVAGAMRAHGAFSRPADYHKWPASKRTAYNKRMAEERRLQKKK